MSKCYKCGEQWTNENRVETPLLCPKCELAAPTGSAAWIPVSEAKPEWEDWPIFAYFGKACDGCKGPCVMLSNWNDTFTHWQSIPQETIWAVWKTAKLPLPPNEKGQP